MIAETIKNTLLHERFISFKKNKGIYKVLRDFRVRINGKENEFLAGKHVIFGENTVVNVNYIEMEVIPINTNEVEIREYL